MRPAIFLEQNGVLASVPVANNQQVQPLTIEQFQINTDAIVPLRRLKAAGFVLIATTNQPGLSRGHLLRRELDRMHGLLRQSFGLDDVLVCPHDVTDGCPCRKPKPGLFTEANFKWHLDLDRSFVISDKWQDAEAARAVGCTSVLVQSPWIGRSHHDVVVPSVALAMEKVLQWQSTSQRVALAV
jgi:D-glycero-D-manno-heptose 1,7-bisphosphate phosphatase